MSKQKSQRTIGSFAVYVERLRAENEEAKRVFRRNAILEKENEELKAALKRRADTRHTNSGNRSHRGRNAVRPVADGTEMQP